MNIIEAVENGKPFRRRSWVDYFGHDNTEIFYDRLDYHYGLEVNFNKRAHYKKLVPTDILAEDWEVKE